MDFAVQIVGIKGSGCERLDPPPHNAHPNTHTVYLPMNKSHLTALQAQGFEAQMQKSKLYQIKLYQTLSK